MSKVNKLFFDIIKFLYGHVGLAILLIFAFLSHPFLKIPYDPWDHLIKIRNIYDHGSCYLYWPDDLSFMCLWHYIWAGLFKIAGINDTFVWAMIIHTSQFILSGGAIYFFSGTVLRIFRPEIEKKHLNILSWIAVLLWFIGNGTHSIVHQQAWIMWYSVSYQGLTMPLFWYMSAIVLQYFFENPSKLRIIFIIIQVIFISAVISAAHPSEQIYFLIHLFILCIIQYKFLLSFRTKTYIYLAFAIIGGIGFFILLFKYQVLPMPLTMGNATWAEMISKIQWIGFVNVDGGWNRLPNSYSEIAVLSVSVALMYRIFMFIKQESPLMRRCYDYLLISSCLFLIIPLTRITSGIVGYVTFSETVWRFVFASPWFVFIPFVTYRVFSSLKRKVMLLIITANIVVIISVIMVSKHITYRASYGNVKSLISSLDSNKVGVQYSEKYMKLLLDIIRDYERRFAQKDKPNLLYMRSDLGIIAKAVYGRDVYMAKIRMPLLTMESFHDQNLDKRYNLIDVDVSARFYKDDEIMKYFTVEKPRYSKRQFIDLPEAKAILVYFFDSIAHDGDYLKINGWAFVEGQSSQGQKTYVILQSDHGKFVFDTFVDHRPDVSKHFGRRDLDDSGFIAIIRKGDIGKGNFRIGLYLSRDDIHGHVFPENKGTILID